MACNSGTRLDRASNQKRAPNLSGNSTPSRTASDDTCALLRRAISPMLWRTTTHFLFPKSERDRIETIFTAASASALPTLPAEIWEMIIRFVYPSNGPIALGWARSIDRRGALTPPCDEDAGVFGAGSDSGCRAGGGAARSTASMVGSNDRGE